LSVDPKTPIFATFNGKLVGMLNYENKSYGGGKGWIVKLGKDLGSTGFHDTRQEAIQASEEFGYEFFIEDI